MARRKSIGKVPVFSCPTVCRKGFRETLLSRARLLGVNALQFVDRCPRMVTQIFRYPLLVDQPAVDTRPNNVALRAHYPLAKLRVLTRVLRTITKHAHLSFEMARIVGALFAFRQALRLR